MSDFMKKLQAAAESGRSLSETSRWEHPNIADMLCLDYNKRIEISSQDPDLQKAILAAYLEIAAHLSRHSRTIITMPDNSAVMIQSAPGKTATFCSIMNLEYEERVPMAEKQGDGPVTPLNI